MRSGLRRSLAALTALALGSCGTNPDGEALTTPEGTLPSDIEIAALLYAGTPRTPPGFLADPAPASFTQVTTYYIKSNHVDAAAPASYELCTDDWTEALAWSETLAQQAPAYLDLVSNEQTERYFELDRVPRGEPERYVRMRAFRCSYLDRSGVDLNAPADFAGTLNHQPLDAASLRDLSEYLWRFTHYNNADHAVLTSVPRTVTTGLAHVITLATLERGAAALGCDRITVREWLHTASEAGELRRTEATLRQFAVRQEGAAIRGC